MNREPLPAAVKGLSLVSFFNDIASEMIYPLLPAFVTLTLGAGATVLGALDGAAELTSAALKWVSGRLADRPGLRKPLILWGYALAVFVRPLTAGATAAWQVVGFRVIDRVGKGLRTAPRDAMLADVTPPGLHGRAFGFHRGADHLGAMLGSLVAWYALTRHAHVREVIGWSVVPGVAAVLVLAAVLRGAPRGVESPAAAATPSNAARPAVISLPVTTPVLLLALLALCRIPETLLLLRLQDLGVSVAAIPLAWAGLHIVRSAASYPGGWLNDRLGSAALVGMGAAIFALCLALLGKPLAPALAVGTLLLFGLAAAATEPAERALVATLSPRARGAGFGAYHALTGVAALPAGVAFGWLYQRFGGSDAMWASGALVGVVGVVWMIRGARPGAR